MSSNQKILVTGNAGFIGSHLTQKLLQLGHRVIGIDNFNDYYNPQKKEANIRPFLTNKNFKQYRLDILDKQGLEKEFRENKIDLIVHLAARAGVRPSLSNPELYLQVNITGTQNMLDLAKKY
ncbi:MAG: GDP-mannose 4,6-dehydratase, partial [Candidatus Beckwithbacteria bacterium]|nr:GDP-mannose 4,6-dehydratase [Candidatus Beckwithbacteria bacterium]